jgi:hypothetical protein
MTIPSEIRGQIHQEAFRSVAEDLRVQKAGMFGERDTPKEALDYALAMFPTEQRSQVATAIMVYHNTLIEAIAKMYEEKGHGTPIWGKDKKDPSKCRIENHKNDCGCALGQCMNGLII